MKTNFIPTKKNQGQVLTRCNLWLAALLVVDACEEWPAALKNLFAPWTPLFAEIMLWITVVLTALSGIIYLWRNRALYLDDV